MSPGNARSVVYRAAEGIFGIDPRSLAAMRIGLGTLLAVDLLARSRHLATFYSDSGLIPRSLVDPWYREVFFSPHHLSGSTAWQAALFVLAGVLAVMLAVGFHTRVAAIGSWVLLTSLQLRNPYVGDFGDEIFRLLLFWSMFLPLGTVWSVDARRSSQDAGSAPVLSVAGAGLLCQIVIMYFVGALHKSGADWHADATAIYYTLNQDWMVRRLGTLLRPHESVAAFMTRSVPVFEYIGAILLLTPRRWGAVRTTVVGAFWLFHLSLAVTITLGAFPWIIGVALIAFLPGWFWNRLGLTDAAKQRVSRPGVAWRSLEVTKQTLAALCLAWVLAHNAGQLSERTMPAWLAHAGDLIRLDQRWVMYSPNAPRTDGWFVIPGRLADGSTVNLAADGAPLSWDKPALISATHPSFRWAIYMIRLQEPGSRDLLDRFASWTCREWNADRDVATRLDQLEIYFMNERTPPPGFTPIARRVRLAGGRCR